jgi:hypothetical protein
MTMSENLGNGSSMAPDRFPNGVSGFRPQRRDGGLSTDTSEAGLAPRNGPASAPDHAAHSLPGLAGLAEPIFPPAGWLESGAAAATMADHPLLRGLLLELPPRGTMPGAGWLDRWFEAARSILELLYVEEAARRR